MLLLGFNGYQALAATWTFGLVQYGLTLSVKFPLTVFTVAAVVGGQSDPGTSFVLSCADQALYQAPTTCSSWSRCCTEGSGGWPPAPCVTSYVQRTSCESSHLIVLSPTPPVRVSQISAVTVFVGIGLNIGVVPASSVFHHVFVSKTAHGPSHSFSGTSSPSSVFGKLLRSVKQHSSLNVYHVIGATSSSCCDTS